MGIILFYHEIVKYVITIIINKKKDYKIFKIIILIY